MTAGLDEPVHDNGMPGPQDFVHTGIVVADLETAMARLGAALGYHWAAPQVRQLDGYTLGGPVSAGVHVTGSIEGPPHLELLHAEAGTLWHTRAAYELHHVAYWSADLAADLLRLVAAGFEMEITGAAGGGAPSSFVYAKSRDGMRIELMSTALRPDFERWLAGGNLPATVR